MARGGGGRSSGGSFGGGRQSGGFGGSRSSGGLGSRPSGGLGSRGPGTSVGRGPSGIGTRGPGISSRPTGAGVRPHHGHHRRHYGPHFVFWPRRRTVLYGRGGGCFGVSMGMLMFPLVIVFLLLLFMSQGVSSCSSSSGNMGGVPVSTVKREPLPSGQARQTDFITDEVRFINSNSKAVSGMRHFYSVTGVQPHLYITDSVFGSFEPTDGELDRFANEVYDRLFDDEAHLLIVLVENNYVECLAWNVTGWAAASVIDAEALEIFNAFLIRYYYQDNISNDEFVSKLFKDSADRIMSVESSPIPVILIIGGIFIIVIVLYNWWSKSKAQKNLEAEQTERILNSKLETFGDGQTDELAKKYEDTEPEKNN